MRKKSSPHRRGWVDCFPGCFIVFLFCFLLYNNQQQNVINKQKMHLAFLSASSGTYPVAFLGKISILLYVSVCNISGTDVRYVLAYSSTGTAV